jgi:hypothetical protein
MAVAEANHIILNLSQRTLHRADSIRNVIVILPQNVFEDYDKGKAVPVKAMKTYRKNISIAPLILNLGSIYRRVDTFMLQQFYHFERTPGPAS